MVSLHENCSRKTRRKPSLPRRVEHMSKEVLKATLAKKRDCNQRAQSIVEKLLEEVVPQDWFLSSLRYVSVAHLEDAVEERSLAKLCGYPLCGQQLPPAPAQRYHISTRLNKVYDITERKKYCSNGCYAAGKHVIGQLQTSPLWLRDQEEAPSFTLLHTDTRSEGAGDEKHVASAVIVSRERESWSQQYGQSAASPEALEGAFTRQCNVREASVVVYVEQCVKQWFTASTLRLLLGGDYVEAQESGGLPLVDHHAQAALRRRILLDRLARVLPDLMSALGVVGCDVTSDMRELVATFHLGAHNITFHVPEWNLLGLVLLNLVGLKSARLARQLQCKRAKDAQTMILLSFQQDSQYLDRLLCWLTDDATV